MNNCLWIQTGHEADKCYYLKSFRLKCPISALSICKRNAFHMEARILRYSNFGWQWFSAMPAQHNHLKILRPRSTPIAFGLIGLGCKPGNGIFKKLPGDFNMQSKRPPPAFHLHQNHLRHLWYGALPDHSMQYTAGDPTVKENAVLPSKRKLIK